uniref:Uncharacterized protein n=1 Tax=uncultured Thiotrichaceae bacterium TaxID=298394 RepID=A0A6S6TNP2_9GAMM|nr:MAG: Unknown protein [uncultured Thiotrichaceae bacterium]
MQLMIDVPNEIGEQLQKLSKPELVRALRLVVKNPPPHLGTTKKKNTSQYQKYSSVWNVGGA